MDDDEVGTAIAGWYQDCDAMLLGQQDVRDLRVVLANRPIRKTRSRTA
ncbi:hypothetical protein STENM327S_07824 [Streptomyces tendae]